MAGFDKVGPANRYFLCSDARACAWPSPGITAEEVSSRIEKRQRAREFQ
jgi:hypothetical protein